jgi:16S rRNA processing protein RimM
VLEEVIVGRIVRPHGVRGEVVVDVRTDQPDDRFQVGVEYRTDRGPMRAESVRWHQGRPLMTFAGVAGRDAAEALRGVDLRVLIDPDEVEVDEDEFHDAQLVGLSVVDAEGAEIGTVSRVDHGPAYETLVVKRRGTRPALIPFVEAMITAIDLDAETITVDLPEGLLEL